MGKAISRKPFYAIAEVCDRWALSAGDIAAYALEGELTLSLPVADLHAEVINAGNDQERKRAYLATGKCRYVGTVDLGRADAFNILQQGSAAVARVYPSDCDLLMLLNAAGDAEAMLVSAARLVVRHAEFEAFEKRFVTLPPLAEQDGARVERRGRPRGAPAKYDWENWLCDMIVIVNEEGVPETQVQLIARAQQWFAVRLGPDNVPCETSIKRRLSRFWPRIKPDVGRPSALHSRENSAPGGGREKIRRPKT